MGENNNKTFLYFEYRKGIRIEYPYNFGLPLGDSDCVTL